jgi:hypothetical protein
MNPSRRGNRADLAASPGSVDRRDGGGWGC